jgi:hypothetical protein
MALVLARPSGRGGGPPTLRKVYAANREPINARIEAALRPRQAFMQQETDAFQTSPCTIDAESGVILAGDGHRRCRIGDRFTWRRSWITRYTRPIHAETVMDCTVYATDSRRDGHGLHGIRDRFTPRRSWITRYTGPIHAETVMDHAVYGADSRGDGHGLRGIRGRFNAETATIDAETLTDAMASVAGSWWMDGRMP